MPHAREQIRDAIITLVTGLTTTGANVFPSRVYPLKDGELPALCVYTFNEEIDDEKGKIEKLDFRYLSVKVDGYAKMPSGVSDPTADPLEDVLDDIASEVETAVLADQGLGVGAIATDLESIEIEKNIEGEKPTAVISMSFKVHYLTDTGTPNTIVTG